MEDSISDNLSFCAGSSNERGCRTSCWWQQASDPWRHLCAGSWLGRFQHLGACPQSVCQHGRCQQEGQEIEALKALELQRFYTSGRTDRVVCSDVRQISHRLFGYTSLLVYDKGFGISLSCFGVMRVDCRIIEWEDFRMEPGSASKETPVMVSMEDYIAFVSLLACLKKLWERTSQNTWMLSHFYPWSCCIRPNLGRTATCRGLTNLEKLKSFFVNQEFLHSPRKNLGFACLQGISLQISYAQRSAQHVNRYLG